MTITKDYCRWAYIDLLPAGADSDLVECHYKFDGPTNGLTDLSGKGHHLTEYNGEAEVWVNTERSLGVGGLQIHRYSDFRGPTGLYPSTLGACTFEAIITQQEMSGYNEVLFVVSGVPGTTEIENFCLKVYFWTGYGYLRIGHESGNGSDKIVNFLTFLPTLGLTTHIAVTRAADGVTTKLYINGQYINTETNSLAPTGSSSANVTIRVGDTDYTRAMYGIVHSLRWTHEEWSAAQILESYEATRVEPCSDVPPVFTPTDR